LYLLFLVILEWRLVSRHCTDCYYYGKRCAFGKGLLSGMLCKKGSPEGFFRNKITWKDMVPDFLVILVPVIIGVWLLLTGFNVATLLLVIILIVLGFFGNAFVRGRLACSHCRQGELGCPARELFSKKKA